MRKQTKVAVVVSAAALLAMGASMTSFAKGWTLEDNEWVYLDSEGERVYGEWKKSVDGNYYWLDEEDGIMATDRLVEDTDGHLYYVKADGTRTTNGWVEIDNEDDVEVNGEIPETIWYYFGSNGKAYKGDADEHGGLKKATINGNISFFNEDGVMQFGWIEYDEKDYFCGTEDESNVGYARKKWQYMQPAEGMTGPAEYADDEWFYFGTNGQLVTKATKYIDGHYYTFDENGVMQDDWYTAGVATSGVTGVATDAKAYADSNGTLGSGWVKATDDADNEDWYYMVTVRDDAADKSYRAVPFNAGSTDGYRAKYIGGKTYLFDTDGKMQTGLQKLGVTVNDEKPLARENSKYDGVTFKYLEDGIYFFEKDGSNEGAMKTGKVSVTTDDVTDYYYMANDGRAITNTMKDKYIYGKEGKMIKAEDGNTYQMMNLEKYVADVNDIKIQGASYNLDTTGGDYPGMVIVSSTGKVRTSGTVRIDGERFEIDYNDGVYTIEDVE